MARPYYFPLIVVTLMMGCGPGGRPTRVAAPSDIVVETNRKDGASIPVKDDWPFEDAENTAVFTLSRILDGSRSILYVIHDEDGDWQFFDDAEISEEDAVVVSLKTIADHDPSIKALADLPAGWAAERTAVGGEWQRFQQ